MTPPILISMPGNEQMTKRLSALTGAEVAALETRPFPDGETYVRLITGVSGRDVAIVCTLDHPNDKFVPLAFTAAVAREFGASRVGLIAPYLAYMRQDHRFKEGEAVTCTHFAHLISNSFDWLVTVEPHLHRHASLDEVYAIPSKVVHADAALAHWIRDNVRDPLIVGPDLESAQWAGRIAAVAQCPYVVLTKRRLGDREVQIDIPDMSAWRERQPLLIDDIISSAATMIEAARLLAAAGMRRPICVGIHGIFAADSYGLLKVAAARVATANTVAHESNEIDLSALIADAVLPLAT
ncbi:MAG TPA: ribose-phosphate pyrophosphokinase [Dongiaceae bacterium]|nr:ribose-phosphate pyrophosphokinase [Dongiaceae bacterium]